MISGMAPVFNQLVPAPISLALQLPSEELNTGCYLRQGKFLERHGKMTQLQ